jgi:ribosomal protein S19E (S16A)
MAMSKMMMKKFAEGLDEVVKGCGNGKPEEVLAELLMLIGLIEKGEEGYRLTEAGKKLLKLKAEQ